MQKKETVILRQPHNDLSPIAKNNVYFSSKIDWHGLVCFPLIFLTPLLFSHSVK